MEEILDGRTRISEYSETTFNEGRNESKINIYYQEKEELELKEFKEVMEGEQSINDGKLEFFTFQSGLSYDMENIMSGFAEKVYHGKGPFLIKFKETPEKVYNLIKIRMKLTKKTEFI